MKAINVERDQQGMWVHPELPVWGENHSESRAEAWFASQGLTHHLILMEGELGERWGCGDLESCAEWQPETEVKDAFLVGIWDTEDGVVAMFASPSKESGETLSQDLMDVIEDCGWEVEDALPLLAAIRVIEQVREPVPTTVLMSRDNPYGWKLEELAEKLRGEIQAKSLNIAHDMSFESQTVCNNNFHILGHLMHIEALQRQSFALLSQLGEDKGPTGKPRIGK